MSAGGVILFCLIFGILLVGWALMGMCSLNEQGSAVPPPRPEQSSVARAAAPLGARATENEEDQR